MTSTTSFLDRSTEPARVAGAAAMAVTGLVTAAVGLLVAFGVSITADQSRAIDLVALAVVGLAGVLTSWWQARATRARVSPVER